ncbi:MAG: hypothetical protein GY944_12380, partial [bacterium]|nr:hypothetical protein [bacterium]
MIGRHIEDTSGHESQVAAKRRHPRTRRILQIVLVCSTLVLLGFGGPHGRPRVKINVLSSPPEYVSGGDARIEIQLPFFVPVDRVRVALDGVDVTDQFDPTGY